MNKLPAVLVIEGELLDDVVVTAEQMASLNEARATFNELRSILLAHVVPQLDGGWNKPLATEIESRLETITLSTRNFFWRSRHAGAAHDAINVGGCQ